MKYQISSKSVQWETSYSVRKDGTDTHDAVNIRFSHLCEKRLKSKTYKTFRHRKRTVFPWQLAKWYLSASSISKIISSVKWMADYGPLVDSRWQEETETLEEKSAPCPLVCHKSQMKWPRTERQLPSCSRWLSNWSMWRIADNKPLNLFAGKMVADAVRCAVWGVGLGPHVCWDCGCESHLGHGCLSRANVVFCQAEASVTTRSLV